jgi:hypothetical protein
MARLVVVMIGVLATIGVIMIFARAGRQETAINRGLSWIGRAIEGLFTAALCAVIGGALLYAGGSYFDDGLGTLVGVLGGLLLFPVFFIRSLRSGSKPTTVTLPHRTPTEPVSNKIRTVSAQSRWFFLRRASFQPDPDRELEAAWEKAIIEADEIASEIAIARRSCRKFLNAAAHRELDGDAIDWAVFIRKHVPNLIEGFFQRCRLRPGERAEAMDALADSLQRIGAEADRRTARQGSETADTFDITREHIRRRTARDPFS